MSRPVMVDSSWYIRQMRLGYDPLRALEAVAEVRDVAICGLIMSEVGRGLRQRHHLERFVSAWEHMLYVESNRNRWTETMEMAWTIDRQGIVLPLQDLHIAACAQHVGAVVLTVDDHFSKIPGVDAVRILY